MCVIGDNHAAVTIGAQVLGGEETQAASHSKSTSWLITIARTDRLGTIFNHEHFVTRSNFHNAIHFARLSVQMNRNDSFGALSNCPLNIIRLKIESPRLNVDENWPGTGM